MTLFTSGDKMKSEVKWALGMFCFALFCAIFGGIYEVFSHEVYSFFMMYAFMIPLLASVLEYLWFVSAKKVPCALALWTGNMAVVTLTVGSLFQGVLEIYGTTSRLTVVYPIAAAVLMVVAVWSYQAQEDKDSKAFHRF